MHTLNRLRPEYQMLQDRPLASEYILDAGAAEPGSKLLDYGRIIQAGWRTVALVATSTLVLALVLRLVFPPYYTARSVLEVRSPNEHFLNREAFDPRSMNSAIGAESYLQTQLQMLDSDQLLRTVLDRLARENEGAGAAGVVAGLGVEAADLEGNDKAKAVERLRKAIRTKVLPQTRLIEVVTTSANPVFSAKLANTLTAQFVEDEAAAQGKVMAETRQMLAKEIDELKTRLVRSQNELNQFIRATGLLMSARNENLLEAQLVQAQSELSAAQADRIRTQAGYEQTAQSEAESLPDVLNDAVLRDYRTNLAGLRRELADLSATLAPKHYRVLKVKAQIDLIEKERAAYQRRIINRLRNDYESAGRRENLLSGVYKQSAARLADQNTQGLRYVQLKGEMDTNRQIYESMLARLKETEVISAIGASNIRNVDPAWPPAKPNAPNLWQSGVLGLGGGLLLGALAALGRHAGASTFRVPGDVSSILRVPALRIGRAGRAPISRRGAAEFDRWTPAALESYAAVIAAIETESRHLLPEDAAAARALGWAESSGRCWVVSSPGEHDGKTVTTAGLGVALARTSRRVLLINGDLLYPRLHQLFDIDNTEGVADLIAEGDLTNLMQLVQPTSVRGLYLLPGGPAVGEAMQLFDSPLVPHLLGKLRGQFDIILIDTPSLLSSADARMIARYADGVIMVVRVEHTARESAAAARQRLASFGLPLAAVVLNDCGAAPENGRRGAAS